MPSVCAPLPTGAGLRRRGQGTVALGNDTDTTAAVAGGLAGVCFGVEALPKRWRRGLRGRQLMQPLLERLLVCCDGSS
ncbi:MAG: ADP-ribosylglycohydrolase family protein [Planctomycetota bacterium]